MVEDAHGCHYVLGYVGVIRVVVEASAVIVQVSKACSTNYRVICEEFMELCNWARATRASVSTGSFYEDVEESVICWRAYLYPSRLIELEGVLILTRDE